MKLKGLGYTFWLVPGPPMDVVEGAMFFGKRYLGPLPMLVARVQWGSRSVLHIAYGAN